jgi:hypothetical protein
MDTNLVAPAAAPVATPSKPDAVKIPVSFKKGDRMVDRVGSICGMAEKILGLSGKKNEKAFMRVLPPQGDMAFCTPKMTDTLQFAKTHSRDGESRYRWETQPDGCEYGYKVEGADDVE